MVIVAILAALGAASCFAASAVLQQCAAQRAPHAKALRIALLIDLLHRPTWLVGLGAAVGGFGLQGVALHYGRLALVQPIILVNLLFAVPIAARLRGRPFQPLQSISGAAIAGSVGLFLAVARPHGGQPDVGRPGFTVLVCAVAAASVAIFVLIARSVGRSARTILLACSAGLLFGLLAAVLDSVTYLLAHRGVVGTLGTWEPYLIAVLAPAGEVFAQSAYQAGPLSMSLPVLNTVEPGTAIAIGALAFGEHIAHAPSALVIEALAAVGVIAGVTALAQTTVDSAAGAADRASPRPRSDTPCQVELTGAVVDYRAERVAGPHGNWLRCDMAQLRFRARDRRVRLCRPYGARGVRRRSHGEAHTKSDSGMIAAPRTRAAA